MSKIFVRWVLVRVYVYFRIGGFVVRFVSLFIECIWVREATCFIQGAGPMWVMVLLGGLGVPVQLGLERWFLVWFN